MAFEFVILAAGQGKRMFSSLPKVLHRLAGKALLQHVVETCQQLTQDASPIIVYGHGGEQVQHAMAHLSARWAHQAEQLGTGHALLQALPFISQPNVLVLYGDVPLIAKETLNRLITETPAGAIGIITAFLTDPTGFGRIIREASGNIVGIVEEKDANDSQKKINEINTGIYLIPTNMLQHGLPILKNHNAQKEYYLTDIITLAAQEKVVIHSIQPNHYQEILGINDKQQLADLERYYQLQYANTLLKQGATIIDPARFDVRGEVQVGRDVIIDVNVIFEGKVTIGNHCIIGPNTLLRNVILGDHVEVKANCVIEETEIADFCKIGPFARLRPGSSLASEVHIGNFVEVKNSNIASGSKINHLSYIGDSDIGKKVNVGAGTITCNYDGARKHRTVIEDQAFIGSNSALVAPITIGENATIAAGSVVTRNAPSHQLTISRAQQRNIANWKRPTKEEK